MNNALCPWDTPNLLIFSQNVPPLLFYSHFTAVIAALILCIFLYLINRKKLDVSPKILISVLLLFVSWVFIDVLMWASNRTDIVLFFWSIQILIEPMIYALSLYLTYFFIKSKLPSFRINLLISILLFPVVIFVPTYLNLTGINQFDCVASEGFLASHYVYLVEGLFILGIIIVNIINYLKNRESLNHARNVYFSATIIFFLISFSSGNLIGSITGDWDMAQYGLFGMPIFVGLLTYLTLNYKIFKTKIIASQVLVILLMFLVGSIIFVAKSFQTKLISGLTLFFVSFFGYMLIRSIKNELKQKEEIQRLAKNLEKANARLTQMDKLKSEFVSIASHQLRSPITAISGYASLLREGSYGQLPPKMMEPIERIERSARMMVSSIEDYLNVSRIESGNMKYDNVDFNLVDEVEHICDDLRTEALRNGLILLFKKKIESRGIIHADLGKIQQVIHNLINNSLKYTQKGTITVYVHDSLKDKKISVDIIDTGIGMSESTLNTIFQKFERGDKANSVNVKGTGLGLFVALKIAEAMGGTIEAFSEGEQKGSRFTIELPLVM